MSPDPSSALLLPPLAARHRTIAFTSGKGGVGKSNLVLNTGLLLAARGKRVALLDGDLGLANLTVLLGRTPKHDLGDVLAGTKRLHEIILRGPNNILVIPAGAGVAELANLPADAREELLEQLEEIEAAVDYLLIDTSAGIGDTVLNLVAASDEAVVVTRPEPTALADAYALMKIVVQAQPAYPFHVLVNMARDAEQADQVYRALSQILLKFLGYRPGYAGFVVNDPSVAQAVIHQVPFTLMAPRSRASRCLETLTQTLAGRPEAHRARPRTFWEKVSGAVLGRTGAVADRTGAVRGR
jgi:flagellar biosynthesis protein FlhG